MTTKRLQCRDKASYVLALTLRGLEDGIRPKIMIAALTLRVLEDGIFPKIMIEALTVRGLEDGI